MYQDKKLALVLKAFVPMTNSTKEVMLKKAPCTY